MKTGMRRGIKNDGVSRWRGVTALDAPQNVNQIFTRTRAHVCASLAAKTPGFLSGGDTSFDVSQRKQEFAWAGSVNRPSPQFPVELVFEP